MSAVGDFKVDSKNFYLDRVGKEDNPDGTIVIFCNGIMNNLSDAEDSARLISGSLDNRKISIFHTEINFQDYMAPSLEQFEIQELDFPMALAKEVKNFIDHHLEKKTSTISVVLFAHSNGACITKTALEILKDQGDYASKIRVYSFGGAALISKKLAQKVFNWIYRQDAVAHIGNVRGGGHLVLYKMKGILETMNNKNLTFEEAIGEWAYRDLYFELDPINRALNRSFNREASNDTLKKTKNFHEYFTKGNLEALCKDPGFLKKYEDYHSLFIDYNLNLVEGKELENPDFKPWKGHSNFSQFAKELPSNIGAMLGNVFKGFGLAGYNAVENHKFEEYEQYVSEACDMERKEQQTK